MQYPSYRLLAVCLATQALAGCCGTRPGTWSQDGPAVASASVLRSGDERVSARLQRAVGNFLSLGLNGPEPGRHSSATAWARTQPQVPRIALPACGQGVDGEAALLCCGRAEAAGADDDRDGMADACEDLLAQRFAPVIYHSTDESNYPTNVDRFLSGTKLTFHDDACTPDLRALIVESPEQRDLIGHVYEGGCGSPDVVRSDGTLSQDKHRGFVLEDVAEPERLGSLDSRDWTTYVHAFPSERDTITIQYWQFFSYNDAVNNHGGDWEGVQLVLDKNLHILTVRLPGHWGELKPMSPGAFQFEGTHVRVYSEGGGHAMRESGDGIVARGCRKHEPCTIRLDNRATHVRQETWAGGKVSWNDGRRTANGPLVNVGSKTSPLNGQVFIQYSGLWGSPALLYWNAGYWGPAFNEGLLRGDGFHTAWCGGMVGGDLTEECHARSVTR